MKETQAKQEKPRIRRAYAADGERSQKMMSFRLDNEVAEWLSTKVNKGRYINELIRTDMDKEKGLPP